MPRVSSNVSEKIYDELNHAITSGKYGTGAIMPSENELAEKYKVSRFFARKALGQLEKQGLIVNRRGIGRQVTRLKSTMKRLGILDDHSVEFYQEHDPLMPGHVFEWQHGIFQACADTGVTSIHLTGKTATLENRLFLLDQLLESNVDAMIFKTGLIEPDDIREMLQRVSNCGIPALCAFTQLEPSSGIDCFYSNFYSIGKLLASHLIDNGHTRIGYIYGVLQDKFNNDNFLRYRGIADAMNEHGIVLDNQTVVPVEFYEFDGEWQRSGAYAISQLHEKGILPDLTALIAFNDEMADGAISRLNELGYRVPDDISIIGFDNDPRIKHRQLTTGYFKFAEETSRIVKNFIGKFNENSDTKIMEVIEPVLFEGNSVKKII